VDPTPPGLPAVPATERGRPPSGRAGADVASGHRPRRGRSNFRPEHPADRAGAVACAVGSGLIVSVMVWSVSTPFTGLATAATGERLMPVGLAVGLGALTTAAVCWRLVAGLRRSSTRGPGAPARSTGAGPPADRRRRRLSGVR